MLKFEYARRASKHQAIILEKIWRGRYVAESEKAIRVRRERSEETSVGRESEGTQRAREIGASVVAIVVTLEIALSLLSC